jgi:hypothetical protein
MKVSPMLGSCNNFSGVEADLKPRKKLNIKVLTTLDKIGNNLLTNNSDFLNKIAM